MKEFKDKLEQDWLESIVKQKIYKVGFPYMWVMTYGWCIIGFYVDRPEPLLIRVAHANHFHQSNSDYGRISQEGAPENCQWRYQGTSLIHFSQIHHVNEYYGLVPRTTKKE